MSLLDGIPIWAVELGVELVRAAQRLHDPQLSDLDRDAALMDAAEALKVAADKKKFGG